MQEIDKSKPIFPHAVWVRGNYDAIAVLQPDGSDDGAYTLFLYTAEVERPLRVIAENVRLEGKSIQEVEDWINEHRNDPLPFQADWTFVDQTLAAWLENPARPFFEEHTE